MSLYQLSKLLFELNRDKALQAEFAADAGAVTARYDLTDEERRRSDANLDEHIALVGDLARRAAPHLSEATARDLASTMNAVMPL